LKEWVYGRRSVIEHMTILPGTCEKLLVGEGATVEPALLDLAKALGLPVDRVGRHKIDSLTGGGNHQSVCLRVSGFEYADPDLLVERVKSGAGTPIIFALDCVQDTRNLGAVLRVADGVGAAGVVIPKDRAAPLSPSAARSAAGAAASVPVAKVTNLSRALDSFKDEGLWVVGADGDAPTTIYESKIPMPVVLVLGGEGSGIRKGVLSRCDLTVSLPMCGAISSLNVGVAAGVLAYELHRRHAFEK
jgi:23S rRNA (guanosine2251-2'-O)-methyltransferase